MKIYTKTGDAGDTGLFGGARVPKNDARVDAYGTVDELNAALGVARSFDLSPSVEAVVLRLQAELFVLGAEIACVPEHVARLKMKLVDAEDIERIERDIDEHESHLKPLTTFILPAGAPGAAALHLARTICRRAERRLLDVPGLRNEILVYLNRTSDALFVLARRENHERETPETPWSGRQNV